VHDTQRHRILGLNWGSRKEYEWKLTGHGAVVKATITNPSYFVDYQDCKYLDSPPAFENPAMLCSGIATLHRPPGRTANSSTMTWAASPRST
jgi:hypothetical protein